MHIVIGIHNRRGDFVSPDKFEFGHMAASDDYFHASMIYYRRKHYFEDKSVIFLIVSNDYEYNLKTFGNSTDVLVMKPEEAIDDMCLLIKLR